MYAACKKGAYPHFRQRPIFDIAYTIRRCAAWLTDMEAKQTESETENK